jgi:hypothetical protein
MVGVQNRAREISDCEVGRPPIDELLDRGEPTVLRGLARNWGLVRAGLSSPADAMRYLLASYNGKPLSASFAPSDARGRLFYNNDFTELNFEARRVQMGEVFDRISAHLSDEDPPTAYIGSTLVDSYLPGFRKENDLDFGNSAVDAPPTIWIGNRTVASCHYDAPNNIACCAVGRRRFTVFPPDQIFNLYPGPLQLTPGGQAVSVVDFSNPDLARYPRFQEAMAAGFVAELEPGDAIFVPSMWWHHVQGLSAFNTLVNYWWSTSPAFIPTPMNTLFQAIWSIRSRPENERRAWKSVFDYYIFGSNNVAVDHLPEQARGILGQIDENMARQIRAMLLSKLNR